jgi:hypothetical protein
MLQPLTNKVWDNYHLTMEKEKSKIQVLDTLTGQKLFECDLNEAQKAYHFAAEMETLGLDIEVKNPTLSETLSNSLGLSDKEISAYKESMEEEIEGHEGSCCFEHSKEASV